MDEAPDDVTEAVVEVGCSGSAVVVIIDEGEGGEGVEDVELAGAGTRVIVGGRLSTIEGRFRSRACL